MSLHHRMMLHRYGLGHTTSLYSTVQFDPIFTPLFTAIFGTAGIQIGAATITFAQIASAIATTALSIGLQMLLAPKPPKPEDGKAPITQAIPFRIFCVGRTRLAGARMLWEGVGPHLYCINALAGHRIHAINRYWLHDDEVEITGYGGPGGIEPLSSGRYGSGGVRVWTRLGANPETAYSEFIADLVQFTGNPSQTIWTTNHRGDGQASTALIAENARAKDQQQSYPYGPPNLSVEVDGATVWDFRDPAQNPDDPSTWLWSKNSALILAWHLCFNEFGFGLDYRKAMLPVIEMWEEEADICDEDVALKGGGTEKRYECNGWDTTENGPKAALNAILSSCDGHLVARGDGARILTVGKFRESRCSTLTDADITGHNIQYDVLFEEEINRLVPKFTYPETGYTTTDTDFFEDTDAQLDAGRVLSEEANYQWVNQWRQARRLGKRDWLRIRQKVRGNIDVRLSGLNAIYSRWVRMETPFRLPRLDGKIVENRKSTLALMRGGFTMDVIENPEDIDAWNPDTDEGLQPPVPPSPNASGIVTPVINLLQAKANAGSVYIRVVIVDPEDDSLTPVVRYRVADADGVGTPGAWIEQQFPDASASGGYVDLATGTVPSDKLLDIQAAFIGTNDSYSDWSVTANITSTADQAAPGAPAALNAVNSAGTVTVTATAANDNTKMLVFKRGTAVQSFAAATQIKRLVVAANQNVSFTDAPGSGSWKYWCGSENGSGLPSATQSSVTVTV